VINELDLLNSSIELKLSKKSLRVFAILSHNGMINELDLLNSSTEQGSVQE